VKHKILLLLFIITSVQIFFSEENNSSFYELAIKYENVHNNEKAIFYYKKFIDSIKDAAQIEKVKLKLVRLSSDFHVSIDGYNSFLSTYPNSRYRFIARYELATIYRMNGDEEDALKEFYKLADISYGTPYWQKSLLMASTVEISVQNYKSAIRNLYKVLEEIEDYEDIGKSYFLLGVALERQENYDKAEELFLICAGSFPQCSKASGALLELMNIYITRNKNNYALKISRMLDQLYTDSPENVESKKIIAKLGCTTDEKLPEIELINLNFDEDSESRKRSVERLITDMNLSNEIKEEPKLKNLNSGYYIQFGYFSNSDNADDTLNLCKNKGITAFIAKFKSSASGNYFYRVLSGPFDSSKTANQKLIEIKEQNIEAIVLELTKDYE
jgi:TolA-binding protein